MLTVSWETVNAILGVIIVVIGSIAGLVAWRKATGNEWEEAAKALETQVRVALARIQDLERQAFDAGTRMEVMESTNRRVAKVNLDLQRQLDDASRRVRQLVAALKAAGIPVPDPKLEDE